MKKIYLLALAAILSKQLCAQTSTIEVLVDSIPGNGFGIIESFENKLYTFPSFLGGPVYEVDQSNGNLTQVAILPVLTSQAEYATYSGNFVFINGKVVASVNNQSAASDYVLAAGNGTVDTLLNHINPYGHIYSIGNTVYLLYSDSASILKLYASDLNSPPNLIDANVNIRPKKGSTELFYGVTNFPNAYDQSLHRTSGGASVQFETSSGSNNSLTLIGELDGDMYYTVCHRTATMDTTWIKSCNPNGITAVVDTIITRALVNENGLVGLGFKLIIPFTREDSPSNTDFYVYDLMSHTYTNVNQNSYHIANYRLEQTQVANNHFYFKNTDNNRRYISDGTIAGTKQYGYQPTTAGNNLAFEDYSTPQGLGNEAIICDEYPLAQRSNNLNIGFDTTMVPYQIYANGISNPSHFNKIGNSIYFTTMQNGNFNKISILKMIGCDLPVNNPLAIKNNANNFTSVYPNPSVDGLFTISNIENKSVYKVYTTLGVEIICSSKLSNNNLILDLGNAPKGIYFVSINNGLNNKTHKLIVQ